MFQLPLRRRACNRRPRRAMHAGAPGPQNDRSGAGCTLLPCWESRGARYSPAFPRLAAAALNLPLNASSESCSASSCGQCRGRRCGPGALPAHAAWRSPPPPPLGAQGRGAGRQARGARERRPQHV